MNFRFRQTHHIVGIFLFFALALLVVAGYFMAGEKKLFVKKVQYSTLLDRGDGISVNTGLTLKGIEIGAITDIHMNEAGKIEVNFEVFPEFANHIKGFTYVRINSSLLGGKTVEIIPSESGPIVPGKSRLPTDKDPEVEEYLAKHDLQHPSDDTSQKISAILENVEGITGNLRVISSQARNPDGDIQRSLLNLQSITSNVATVTGALKEKTPELKSIMVDAKTAAQDTSQMIRSTKESGLFRAITPAPPSPERTESIMHLDPRNTKPQVTVP